MDTTETRLAGPEGVGPPTNLDFREYRRRSRNRKLHRQMRNLIQSQAGCRYVGVYKDMEVVTSELGFKEYDLVLAEVRIGSDRLIMVCPPHHVWRSPRAMEKVARLAETAKLSGVLVKIISQNLLDEASRPGASRRRALK